MFKNRAFDMFVGLVIAVLAVLSIGTAIYNQQGTADNRVAPLDWYLAHDHVVPTNDENATTSVINGAPDSAVSADYAALKDRQLSQMDPVPENRIPSSAYVSMKDRALNQLDGASIEFVGANFSSAERYAALKASQLQQAEAMTAADPIGIAMTGAAKPVNAVRYANLKDAQLARSDPVETISAGRARYLNLKEVQLERPGLYRAVTAINDPYVPSLNPGLSNER